MSSTSGTAVTSVAFAGDRKRRYGHGNQSATATTACPVSIKSCLSISLLPAALLGFGAFSLLLAHESLGKKSTTLQYNAMLENMWKSTVLTTTRTEAGVYDNTNTDADNLYDYNYNSESNGHSYFLHHPPDAFEEAFYLADEPDYETYAKVYEDSDVLRLKQNKSYVPFNIFRSPNGSSVLVDAGKIHPVLTALRDVANIEEFFNPVCFRYVFPNVTMFPTISVIVPMQNGKSKHSDTL